MIAAKLSAPRISQTVVSMLDMPPLENRSSIVALPLADTNPLAMRLVHGLDAVEDDPLVGFVDERLDGGALGEAGEDPGEHGDAEDAEERRDLAERDHDQQRQGQQVERGDVERRRQDVAGFVDADGRRRRDRRRCR